MFELNNQNHKELTDDVEWLIAKFCNDNRISGQLAWLVIHNLAAAKLDQFKGNQK